MSEEWAKRVAAKIAGGKVSDGDDRESARIVKIAEKARALAAERLFSNFRERIDSVCRHLEKAEGGGMLRRLFAGRRNPVFSIETYKEIPLRFQTREAWGDRLDIFYNRGYRPGLRIDVAVSEDISGTFYPIFRENGAIAGAQIWRLRESEGKHPDLVKRLFLILSKTAVDEGFKPDEAVCWMDEEGVAFTTQYVEKLIEELTLSS